MNPSVLEKALITISPLLIYLVAGIFILSTGRGIPPDNKYLFGIATLIIGLIGWIFFRANYARLTRLSLRKALRAAVSLLLLAILLGTLYATLIEYCVIKDPRLFTIYYPMWSAGELAQAIKEEGGRHKLTAAYGPGTLNKLITGMPGYPLPIIVTTFVLLALLEGVFISASSICAIFLARVPTKTSEGLERAVFDMSDDTKIKVLFLASNPQDTDPLRLDKEFRSIDERIRLAEFRDKFDLRQQWAVRVGDLQGYLLQYKPNIIHFSGHGSSSSEIILEGEDGNSRAISSRALSQLFSILKGNLSCVVLNACYSEQQAKAIAQHIDHVVGMSKAISDLAAISFAAAFYQAIGYGEDIETAFKLACNQIDLENLDEQDTPKLISH